MNLLEEIESNFLAVGWVYTFKFVFALFISAQQATCVYASFEDLRSLT